jgi:ferric-chelate reductase
VLAIVGGTGITGALSLANWWITQQSAPDPVQQRLKIIWSIRDTDMADIVEIKMLQERFRTTESRANLEIHISSQSGRMDPAALLQEFLESQTDLEGNTFVYISGPRGLAAGAEAGCVQQKGRLNSRHAHGGKKELEWYNASFEI